MANLPASAEVIIIGAGIQGVSTAYHLVTAGVDDLPILEAGKPAVSGSTPRSAAMLVHQTGIPDTTTLAMQSIQQYSNLQEAGYDIGLRRTGGVLFATTARGARDLREQAAQQQSLGLPTQVLGAQEVAELTGGVLNVDDIEVGIYCEREGYLDPRKLVRTYLQLIDDASKRHGVSSPVRPFIRATRINASKGRVRSVDTATKETIECRAVVNCGGVEARRLASHIGIPLPIQSSLRCLAILGRADLFPEDHVLIEHLEEEWYFRPHGKGVLVGFGPHEWVEDDDTVDDPEFDESLWADLNSYLTRFLPRMFPYTVVDRWAGYRPLLRTTLGAADDLPILGPDKRVDGYFNCNGVGAYGVTLGAICGELVAEAVLGSAPASEGIAGYSSERFSGARIGYGGRTFGWTVDDNMLRCGAFLVEDLAERVGTPLYLYDADILRRRLALLRRAFPGIEVSYSIKSNPNTEVCKLLASEGLSAGVSSLRELHLAFATGFGPGSIDFAGPGKTDAALEEAIVGRAGLISVESLAELGRLEAIAAHLGVSVDVLIRVNTVYRPTSAGEFMAGLPSPFGIDEETVPAVLNSYDRNRINVLGFHAFVASQVLSADNIALQFERVAEMALRFAEAANLPLRVVNFGGGFGVPYSQDERGLDIVALGREILDGPAGDLLSRDGCRGMIEVGRFLTAEAGLFVTRVVDVKTSRGTKFVVTDSGISGLSRPAMPWAQDHGAAVVTRVGVRARNPYKVVGPSCMPSDVLCESVQLPDPAPGDLLGVYNAGAYGRSMSMLQWGGFPTPVEAFVDRGRLVVEGVNGTEASGQAHE